ncbi:unnamed protein product, partial [Mesorhabditis belari]|uniref:Uncharacterized protein n=1 Tax=Mesorhabditis belari TaxID=2138241 RepID=A0AAF3EDK8_9BILA
MLFHETSVYGLLKYGGSQNMEIYNCSATGKSLDEWYATGRSQPILGFTLLTYGSLIELLYVPSLYVISGPSYIKMPCYKIMCLLGILDMFAIVTNSLLTGYLLIKGAVFCTNPDLIFYFGAAGVGFWCAACMCCLLLVINRLFEIWKPHMAERIFKGWKFIIILTLPILYGAYFFFYTPPVLFTSIHDSWFFDPFIFENRTAEYMNPPHTINNLLLCAITCLLYTALCGVLAHQFGQGGAENKMSWGQRSIFIQSTAICIANLVAALIYVFMQFFPTPAFCILLGHFCWELCHGFPALVYVTINRSVRRDIFRLIGLGHLAKGGSRNTVDYKSDNKKSTNQAHSNEAFSADHAI